MSDKGKPTAVEATNVPDLNEHKKKYASNAIIKETLEAMIEHINDCEPDTEHEAFFSVLKDSEGAWSMSLLVEDDTLPELILALEDHREVLKQIYYGE